MKYKIGIDSIEIERVEKACGNEHFLKRVYGENELKYFEEHRFSKETMAGSFAAKEAFSKAVGTGLTGFKLNEVEVLHEKTGRPYYKFSGSALNLAENYEFDLSITHTKKVATAVTIMVKRED